MSFAEQQLMCQLPTVGFFLFFFQNVLSSQDRFSLSAFLCLKKKDLTETDFVLFLLFHTGLYFLLRCKEFTFRAMPSVF